MRFEPVLCDFDGTLADSEPVIIAALRSACGEVGIRIPADTALRACIGPPLERTLPEILGGDAPISEVIHAYRRHYMAVAPTGTALMPDALDAVKAWTHEGIRVGIVSYKPLPLIKSILYGLGLSSYMSVLRAPPIGVPPRSKTALLVDALNELQPHQARPVFIGDHLDDELAAAEAGIDFIRYPDSSWSDIQLAVLGS